MLPLGSVLRVVLQQHPEVEVLNHVVQALYAFIIVDGALLKAVKANRFHLFTVALQAVDQSSDLTSYEKLQQYRHAIQVVPAKMTNDKEALTAFKKLYKRHPASVDCESVSAITNGGNLKIMHWLCESQGSKVFTRYRSAKETAFSNASLQGHDDIVQWLVGRFPDIVCDLTYAAKGGHFDQIRWLAENANWYESSIRRAVEEAAITGDLEMVNFLHGISTVPYKESLRSS